VKNKKHNEAFMEALFAKVRIPLYEGCSTSMLSTMLLLLNLNIVHNVSNTFMDELFSLFKKNCCPKTIECPSPLMKLTC
jgi:hypothetical protein